MSDRRVKYTKRVLHEALLRLLADKPINKIQIKEICELADVNRGTFYNHYDTQQDLLAEIEDEFAAGVMELVGKRQSDTMDALAMMTGILTHVAEQRTVCRVLFSASDDDALITRLMNLAYDSFKDRRQRSDGSLPDWQLEMLYVFVSAGGAAVIRRWVLNEAPESPHEIAQFILQAMDHGSYSFRPAE